MATIPSSHADLLTKPNFAHVATHNPDGSIQVSPVWIDFDGTYVIINTAEGRAKTRNMDGNLQVSLSVHDQENPYRYLQVRGHVAERTNEGAEEHIDFLAKKYTGADVYGDHSPERRRVIFKVAVDKTQTMG